MNRSSIGYELFELLKSKLTRFVLKLIYIIKYYFVIGLLPQEEISLKNILLSNESRHHFQ